MDFKKNLPAGFGRWGRRTFTVADVHKRIDRSKLKPHQKEYVKRVLERFDSPHEPSSEKNITAKEFAQAIDEMSKNPHDQIGRHEIDQIKRVFNH